MAHLPPEQNKVIAGAISRYLEEHSQEPVLLKTISKHLGYSVPWIRTVFKRETGKSIIDHLLFLRIQRAKRLLRNTDLDITKIAMEVGFSSYTRFAIAFKKRTGISAKEFRNLAESGEEATPTINSSSDSASDLVRFQDFFTGPALKDTWNPRAGEWTVASGALSGRADQSLILTYVNPLPERFHLSFDFMTSGNPYLCLIVHGEEPESSYAKVEFGNFNNQMGRIALFSLGPRLYKGKWIRLQEWQRFDFELSDDLVTIHLDYGAAFSCKVPFPPPFALRSRFSIIGWNGVLQIRNLVLNDLGFTAIVSPHRRADTLYNTGIFDLALSTYMRLLESATNEQEILELQYKIGVCFLKQEAFGQAEVWLSKVQPLAGDSYWFSCARGALHEIKLLRRDLSGLLDHIRKDFQNESCRDLVRSSLERSANEYADWGFFDKALLCAQTRIELEAENSLQAKLALRRIPDLLYQLRRYTEATDCLNRIIRDSTASSEDLNNARINLVDILCQTGQFREAENLISEIRSSCRDNHMHLRFLIHQAVAFRGQSRFAEAIELLLDSAVRFSGNGELTAFALMTAANIHSQLGQTDRARKIILEVGKQYGKQFILPSNYAARFDYPAMFADGRYHEGAEILLATSYKGAAAWMKASLMVRAGILFELAQDGEKAGHVWEDTAKLFPEKICCFWGTLAGNLADNKWDMLEGMPYAAIHRAEMFYLAGKLLAKRGDKIQSRRFYELSVAEDPTLNWFAWMAKNDLGNARISFRI